MKIISEHLMLNFRFYTEDEADIGGRLTKMTPLKMNIITLRNPEQHMVAVDGPHCGRRTQQQQQQQSASVPGKHALH